jgi:hypothetical protein
MLYIIWGEGKKAYLKKQAEDDLESAETESEVLSMMEETKNLEEENRKRKEALYSTEETEVESN